MLFGRDENRQRAKVKSREYPTEVEYMVPFRFYESLFGQ